MERRRLVSSSAGSFFRGLVCVLAVLVAVTPGCASEDESIADQQGADEAAARATIRQNPCDATLTTRMDPADTVVARLLAGAADLGNEAHDCQRLVLRTGIAGEFGPLVGLFAVSRTLGLAKPEFVSAQPAVSIYNWGAVGTGYLEHYEPLDLAQGGYCLWLHNPVGTTEGWRAAIGAGLCGGSPTPPNDEDFGLRVFERTYPDAVSADYPSTARWEWDLEEGRQFVGVRCGDAWCAVTTGSGPPRTTVLPRQARGYDLARLRIPGWSDAQHLAVVDSTTGRVRPGPWGALLSHPFLHQEEPTWTEGILAAAIEVQDDGSRDYDRLVERWFLQPGDGSARGDVILRFPGVSPNEAWWQQGPMRRRRAAGVEYTPAMTSPATGAVRWRWRDAEPWLWIQCRAGSCSVID